MRNVTIRVISMSPLVPKVTGRSMNPSVQTFSLENGMTHMMGDQAMARSCYVRAVDNKKVIKEEEHKMVSTVYQLGDEFLCDIKEGGTFGELDQ